MRPDDYFAKESARLEAEYSAGNFPALVEALVLFSGAEPARPLPAWATEGAVDHLIAHYNSGAGQGLRGKPGPKVMTAQYEKRVVRVRMVEIFRMAVKAGAVELYAQALNRGRVRAHLPAIDPAGCKDPFELASRFLRGGPAQASRKTVETTFYRAQREQESEDH